MWTKGKWKTDNINLAVLGEQNLTIAYLVESASLCNGQITRDEAVANMEHICQCVNNFDDLLEACEEALHEFKQISWNFVPHNCDGTRNKLSIEQKLEGVIQKAKESNVS